MNDTKLQQLESKVAKLEEEIGEIKRLISDGTSVAWWKQISGTFKDDPVFAEIVELGRKIRREEITMEFKETPKNTRRKGDARNSRTRQVQKGKR